MIPYINYFVLTILVNYEIFKTDFDDMAKCNKYSYSTFAGSYDEIKMKETEKLLIKRLNCTTPFSLNLGSEPICRGSNARLASKILDSAIKTVFTPCTTMTTSFGYPFSSKSHGNSTGFARLYLKNIVKLTQDIISYDLLRFIR